MGNGCTEIECQSMNQLESTILNLSIVDSPSNQILRLPSSQLISNVQKSRILSFVHKLKDSQVNIPLCAQNETETRSLRINVNKNILKFHEHLDKQQSLIVHVVQLGNFVEATQSGDGITMKMINDTKDDKVMITIFAGKYVNGEEAQGMYASVKWQKDREEAFLFKGVKNQNQYKGFKLLLEDKGWDKFWGHFDKDYLIQGKGKHVYFSGQHYQFYEGNFFNGKKEQNQLGRMKIFDLKRLQEQSVGLRELQSANRQFLKAISVLKTKLYILRSQDQDEICDELMKIISKGAVISPKLNKYFVESDKQCKILIEGMWVDDKIEGFTRQLWPLIDYKYVGMYRGNQRCGYGQQYEDDVLIAKGFYKHNEMKIMTENQHLYKGYRYIDGKSSRRVQ